MQWWNDFIGWFYSDTGWRVISTAIIPFLAIVVAGIVAAIIGRASIRRLLAVNDRELRAAAVTTMIGSARRAAVWNTLSVSEQRHADHAALEADIRLRLLPVAGASLASDWASHEIAQMKKNAVSFSFQAEQSLTEFRSRLIDWHTRPSRAKKLFKNDLDSWAYESSLADQDLVSQQQAWAAQQGAGAPEPAAGSPAAPPAIAPPAVAPAAVVPAAPRPAIYTPPTPVAPVTRPFTPTATPTATPQPATPQPATPEPVRPTTGESAVVDERAFPPPVSVNQVRDRINPPRDDEDDLR